MAISSADCYWEYLKSACLNLDSDSLARVDSCLENTLWDNPTSALDLNNFAVIALIEAEHSQDLSLRILYLDMALEALNKGVELDGNPLCIAHLAIVLAMTGEKDRAMEIAYPTFINTLQPAYSQGERIPSGIVYIPRTTRSLKNTHNELIKETLQAQDGYTQSLLLLSEALCRSPIAFYNKIGLRFLHLANQLFPCSIFLNLKLGIYSILNSNWEGLFYLHRAREMAPNFAPSIQALYVIYRDLNQKEVASFWLGVARDLYQMNPDCLDLQWSELGVESPITCVPFENELQLAVLPSFLNIVTSVLISEGDWFEKELEFWRNWIKPGMTVIDVGANVGIYTFSAALRVGSEGRVIAIEPFSGCVHCLQATCQINQLSWVKVYAGAASNREGTARLSLHSASELNEILSDASTEAMQPGSFEEVNCFTLDSLIEVENLSTVDFIKIDAEGHEMSVLAGSERLLSKFAPIIIYENQAGFQGSNIPLADYLSARGYQLFCYLPYRQELIPIKSAANLDRKLNIIAIPDNQVNKFIK